MSTRLRNKVERGHDGVTFPVVVSLATTLVGKAGMRIGCGHDADRFQQLLALVASLQTDGSS